MNRYHLLLSSCVMAIACCTQGTAAEWPCWRGPTGSGMGSAGSRPLVRDLKDARLVWRSEAQDIPGSHYHRDRGRKDGGYASPIVANGKVFQYYFLPSGDVVDEAYDAPNNPVAARDVLLCVDAASGKTLWKRDLGEDGINLHFAGKHGYHHSPCWHAGRVYVQSTLGRVFCLDDKDGRTIWVADVPTTAAQRENLALRLEQRTMGGILAKNDGRKKDMPTCVLYQLPLQVADEVVIADGGPLVGLCARTGEELWQRQYIEKRGVHHDRCGPLRWRSGSREFIIAGRFCLVPKTGEVVWEIVEAKANKIAAPTLGDGYIVYNGKGPQCFAITADGYELRWEHGDIKGSQSVGVIHDGWYFVLSFGPRKGSADHLYAIELATGERWSVPIPGGLDNAKIHCQSMVGAGDRLFTVLGRGGHRFAMASIEPGQFGWLGKPIKSPVRCYTTPAIVDGRLYARGANSLCCYDLRITREGAPGQ